jgi:hypothetical protein
MTRRLLTALVACAALLAGAALSAAAALGSSASHPNAGGSRLALPSVSSVLPPLPTVSVPSVSVPSVTVPSVTVPSVTIGPITTPTVSTPSITTPTLSTPTVTVPPIRTPPVNTPPVTTPSVGSHTISTPSGVPSPSNAVGAVTSALKAPSVTAGSASGTSRASRPSNTAAGATRRSAGNRQTGSGHAQTGTSPRSGSQTAGGGGAFQSDAQPGTTQPGGRASRTPPRATKSATATSGPIGRLVKALPTAVLVALLAFGVIAAAMALNAYLQSRRARSLAGQREALLSDVGVLQAALLPSVPGSLGELDVSVAYRPAQGLAAGGDFFDVFSVAPERTGIIIGDVSGHGRESLIHAALVRYTLRALMGEGHPLPEVLARADRYLRGELGDGFATVIICCYDHTTAELTWAKAGHEPPIIAGQPERDEKAATPLGLGLGDTWPQFSRSLAPGERVCLFTDGLTEARRQGGYLGRAHLKSLVEQGLSAQALVERIQTDADDCSDDLAAVVLSRATAVADPQANDAQANDGDPTAARQAATV